jgi:hypothetical protein
MHHVVLQSFLIIHQPKIGANEVDGKMARARRWQRNFSIIDLAKNGEERMRGRVPFIPQEAKGRGLDQCQVLV